MLTVHTVSAQADIGHPVPGHHRNAVHTNLLDAGRRSWSAAEEIMPGLGTAPVQIGYKPFSPSRYISKRSAGVRWLLV
jgi:hypothetical protein